MALQSLALLSCLESQTQSRVTRSNRSRCFDTFFVTHQRAVESSGAAMLLLTRRITRHPAVLVNAARKTSWAAPDAPSWLRRVEHWLRPPAPSGDPLQLLPWELTSPAALEVGSDSARDADLLAYAGVVVRRNAVCRDTVGACRVRAEELAAEATRRATAKGADAGDASAGFHFADASQRGPFRLDLRLGAALEAPPFDLPLEAIWSHVRAALGDDAVLRRRGLVVGLPGASDQAYHADAPRVPPDVWLQHEAAESPTQPPHSLVVFLPLCDLNEANGPTSFLPGSHQRWTSDALEAEADAPGSSSAGAPAILDVDAGDAIIFDSRTQHAGGANRSQCARPILYLVFARPWFDEAMHRRLVVGGDGGGGDGAERLFPEFSVSDI